MVAAIATGTVGAVPIPADEIATKQFLTGLRGYDRAEVDAYLQVVAAEQRRLLARIEELERPAAGGSVDDHGHQLTAALEGAARDLAALRRELAETL
jgi:DivIVA domain-containing protein